MNDSVWTFQINTIDRFFETIFFAKSYVPSLQKFFISISITHFNFQSLCSSDTMPSALVVLSEGAEEMEAVISIDVMRRGEVQMSLGFLHSPSPYGLYFT